MQIWREWQILPQMQCLLFSFLVFGTRFWVVGMMQTHLISCLEIPLVSLTQKSAALFFIFLGNPVGDPVYFQLLSLIVQLDILIAIWNKIYDWQDTGSNTSVDCLPWFRITKCLSGVSLLIMCSCIMHVMPLCWNHQAFYFKLYCPALIAVVSFSFLDTMHGLK